MAVRCVKDLGRWLVSFRLGSSALLLVLGSEVGHGCCRRKPVVVGVWSPPVVEGLDIVHGGLSGGLAGVKVVVMVELVLQGRER